MFGHDKVSKDYENEEQALKFSIRTEKINLIGFFLQLLIVIQIETKCQAYFSGPFWAYYILQ